MRPDVECIDAPFLRGEIPGGKRELDVLALDDDVALLGDVLLLLDLRAVNLIRKR